MSMMARFVSVAPDQLAAMKKSPDLVEELLARGVASTPFAFTPAMQERARAQAPKLLGGMLEKMTPELRQQLIAHLVSAKRTSMPRPWQTRFSSAWRKEVRLRCDNRRGKRESMQSTAFRSIRHGTGCTTYCAEPRKRFRAHSVKPCLAVRRSVRIWDMDRHDFSAWPRPGKSRQHCRIRI